MGMGLVAMSSGILATVLREALADLPPGTKARDLTSMFDDYTIQYDFSTEYDPALACGYPPGLITHGSYSSMRPMIIERIRDAVARTVKKHNEEWAFIHGPEVAAAAKTWAERQAAD